MILKQLQALVGRDLRLLARSKSSSAVILLGPLLVILLVGVVFSGSGQGQAVLGVIDEGFDDFDSYTDMLADSFTISSFSNISSCVESTKRGVTAGCIVFSSSDTAQIHVDPTDTSLLYLLVDQVTAALDQRTGQLRSGLTSEVLSAVSQARSIVANESTRLSQTQVQLQEASELLTQGDEVLSDISFMDESYSGEFSDELSAIDESYTTFVELSNESVTLLVDLSEEHNDSVRESQLLFDRYEDADIVSRDVFVAITNSFSQIESSADSSASQLASARSTLDQGTSALQQAQSSTQSVSSGLADSLDVLSLDVAAGDITSPLTTEVVPIESVESSESFGGWLSEFLVLLVMFTSLLLASQLVVKERSSRAYFRNFTTPTADWMFVLSTYLSTLIVLAIQLVLLFVVVVVFSDVSVLTNFAVNSIVLLIVVSFFSFLGMLLGYIFTTREGVMLAAISTSSALMLISSLVLPIQTLPSTIQFLVAANPFVISSDLLTSSLIYGLSLGDMGVYLLVLCLYVVMLFAAIMLTQRFARVSYFESKKTALFVSSFLGEQEVPEGKELRVHDFVVSSKRELLAVLKELSDDEYEQFADHQRNLFADWVRDVYKDDRLARMLRNTSRQGAIAVLKKEI